jgi:hypothetical protein
MSVPLTRRPSSSTGEWSTSMLNSSRGMVAVS